MSSLFHESQMSEQTAREVIEAFAHSYHLNAGGEFVNKIGEPAPTRSIDLVVEAHGILADTP